MKKPIITDELLKEIEDVMMPYGGEGYTTEEIHDTTGIGINKVREILRFMKKMGRLKVTHVYRENIAGDRQKRPAYILLDREVSTD